MEEQTICFCGLFFCLNGVVFVFSVAKPLFAKSHELSLAYDKVSLQKLKPPLVLQEFINHGMYFINLNLCFRCVV